MKHILSALRLLLVFALVVGCSGESLPNSVPRADSSTQPENLSWVSRAALKSFLDFNVWMGWRSGFVVSVARDGKVIHSVQSGYADLDSKRPLLLDTRLRIASMTKPVTGVAAMILIEDGRLSLDDEIAQFIPAAANARVAISTNFNEEGVIPTEALQRPITVRDLLMFSAGIGDVDDTDLGQEWSKHGFRGDGKGNLATRAERVFKAPLYEQPGTHWRYGWSADVLARVIEVASAQPFDQFLQKELFEPLGMHATSFAQPGDDLSDLATMYTQDENGDLVETAASSHTTEWASGGGGLISTTNDYMRFALMLWNEGEYQGQRILKPESVKAMHQPHVKRGVLEDMDIEGLGWGYCFSVVVDESASLMTDRDGDFWWAGFYDTKFFISPSTGIVAVVMAQNEPGPYSPLPWATHAVQSFIYAGL